MPEPPNPAIIYFILGMIVFWVVLAAFAPYLRRRFAPAPAPSLHEASMNFDTEGLAEYLTRLPSMIDRGFGSEQIGQVMTLVNSMAINDEKLIEFPIVYQTRQTTLVASIFMDDEDAPDVAFFTDAELADRVQSDMGEWAESKGM